MKWLLSFAILALVAPISLAAHPGHDHKVMGVVNAIHENHLEVKDAKGKLTTHTLDATTKITRGKLKVAAADIKVGDRVVVTSRETKDKAGKAVMNVVSVQVGVAETAPPKQ
jgi:hypothetical protein